MKPLLVFLLLTAALQVQSQPAEPAVRTILNEQVEAWNAGSLEGFMKGYWNNDSLMFIGKNGVSYGYKAALANYQKGFPDKTAMGRLSYDILHINQIAPDYCYVVGSFLVTRSIGNLNGHFTLLVKKVNGKWLIISDQSS